MVRALLIGPEDDLLRSFVEAVTGLKELNLCQRVASYLPLAELGPVLEQAAPGAVVISLADYNAATALIGELVAVNPVLPVIALHTYCDQRLLMELMQIGVRELWFPPFNREQIGKALGRLLQQRVAGLRDDRRGSLVAFLPARGGCGSTTVALHTAAALQKARGSVLLADFDFHNSTISFWLKIETRHGFREALERAHWLDEAMWKSMITRVRDLDILTAPQTSVPMDLSSGETSAVLEYARRNYRFVLVDLPDSIFSSCWEVLEQAHHILLTATPEMASLYLARRKIAQIVDRGIPRNRIQMLLNRVSPNDLPPAEVEKFLALPVAACFSNHYRAITAAFADASFVSEGSKLGTQFSQFAESLAPAVKATTKPKTSWKIRQIFSSA
ncbi:MAG: AAA family ATPase [Acidobacteria bacterium]|nr:AAA family ATPase [Acidobacteriota bacterium]